MTAYAVLLTLHNLVRWAVLLTGLWAIFANFSGRSAGRAFTAGDKGPTTAFMASLHLQVLLGLSLFALQGMSNMPTFPDAPRPSFTWEHLGIGLLAAVFATIANSQAKRGATDQARWNGALLWSALAWVPLLLMIPWFRPLLRFFGA